LFAQDTEKYTGTLIAMKSCTKLFVLISMLINYMVAFPSCGDYWAVDKKIDVVDTDLYSVHLTRETLDIPENEGVRNVLLNAAQLVDLTYSPVAILNCQVRYNIGTMITGLIYSSTRYEDLFCPNNVSLWTFMTALSSPNSYLYTQDISKTPYNIRGIARAYYGQVCTSFIQYALGIKYNFQIYQMSVWDGLDRLAVQSVDSLKLGDVLITQAGHTRLVTGIHRNYGIVSGVEISEGVPPVASRRQYEKSKVEKMLADGYVIFRYRYISSVKHTPTPFVSVGQIVLSNPPSPNNYIMPRRGDRANWRKDEHVVVDIKNRGEYTGYKVFRNGNLKHTGTLDKGMDVIDFGVMKYGKYEMCLTGGDRDSEYVSWIVVDYNVAVASTGNHGARVFFSSSNATPCWITWRRKASVDADNNNMPLWTDVITEKDARKGTKDTELVQFEIDKYGLNPWEIKVAFETEYGIISSDSCPVELY
jgi:hypothetical protein